MSFCLFTCIDNLLDMNQTKYLIRPIIMIITIISIKNKTRKCTASLIINSLTHVGVSGGQFFYRFVILHKAEWFKILKPLIMAWAVEEDCLEINVILMQYMSV